MPKNAFVVPKTTMSAPIQKSYWAQSPAKNQFDALSLVEQSLDAIIKRWLWNRLPAEM